MIGDCVGYRSEGGKLVFVRQMFQGKTVADVSFSARGPWFRVVSGWRVRADLVQAHASGKAPVNSIGVQLTAAQIRTKPLELFKEAKSAVDLTQRRSLSPSAAAFKAPENIPQAEAVAKAMGAEIAASRPICDERLASDGAPNRQLRQTVGAKTLSRARLAARFSTSSA